MAEFWTAEGTVEALGQSELKKEGTEYSVVRLVDPAGGRVTFQKVGVGPNVSMDLAVDAVVRLLGYRVSIGNVIYAVVRDGQPSSDLELWGKARRTLMLVGWSLVLLGLALAITIVGIVATMSARCANP